LLNIFRLYERKTLDGMKDKVVVMDILSDLIKEEMAVKNDEHMAMLYRLCETVLSFSSIEIKFVKVFLDSLGRNGITRSFVEEKERSSRYPFLRVPFH